MSHVVVLDGDFRDYYIVSCNKQTYLTLEQAKAAVDKFFKDAHKEYPNDDKTDWDSVIISHVVPLEKIMPND